MIPKVNKMVMMRTTKTMKMEMIHHHRVVNQVKIYLICCFFSLQTNFLRLVNTRLQNANLQSRARELLNKKQSKKSSSKTDFDDIDNNSTLNRTLLPDYDGVVYTLDAKLIGNIGRYFNHSCSPNIAVQNVFVDVSLRCSSLIFIENFLFIDT